jgi:hypothetical protein
MDEVSEAEAFSMLLAEEGTATRLLHRRGHKDDVITVTVCVEELEEGIDMVGIIQLAEQLFRLFPTLSLLFRIPQLPRMIVICPVDIGL